MSPEKHNMRRRLRPIPATRRYSPTLTNMQQITGAGRETRLFMHAVASAWALASQTDVVVLDLAGERESSPAAQKVVVAEKLAEAMTGLEKVIRAKKTSPSRVSVAAYGRKLAKRDEVFDAHARTYTPGPGFQTLIESLVLDAGAEAEKAS